MSQQRGPIVTGVIGMVVIALALAVVVVVPQATMAWRTDEYTAEFANAAGIRPGGKVHIAGVPSGEVTDVELSGNRVLVRFQLDSGQRLGTATSASVKVATVMGKRYLAIQPAGLGRMESGAVIPRSRTSVPYSLDELGKEASSTARELDLRGLRTMMSTLQTATPDDPELIGQALTGVAGAAKVVTRHEQQIDDLINNAQSVSTALVQEQDTLVKLLGDADLVMRTLDERRDTIRQLISDVDSLVADLDRFFAQNSEKIGPLLTELHGISEGLTRNDKALADTMALLAPASKGLANATGNGTWGDVAGPAGPLPDNLLCLVALAKGCR